MDLFQKGLIVSLLTHVACVAAALPCLARCKCDSDSTYSCRNLSLSSASLTASMFLGWAPTLKTVDFSYNVLDHLPDDLFADLPVLASLDLSHNRIANITTRSLSSLPALSALSLASNRLVSIDLTAMGSDNLLTLDVSSNLLNESKIQGIATSKLTSLSFAGNNIGSGIFDMFHSMPSLSSVDLSFNKLSTVPDNAFLGAPQLRTLALNNNNVSALTALSFTGLASLSSLSLSYNDLVAIPEGALFGLGSLTELQVDHNLLSGILPVTTFRDLVNVRTLSLSSNKLTAFPTLSTCRSLSTFQAWSNSMTGALPADLAATCPNLVTFNVLENQLSSFSATTFAGMKSLSDLSIGCNKFSVIPDGAFRGLTSVYNWGLFENELSAIPAGAFADAHNANWMEFHCNRLSGTALSIPNGTFAGLTSSVRLVWVSCNSAVTYNGLTDPNAIEDEIRREASSPSATVLWTPQGGCAGGVYPCNTCAYMDNDGMPLQQKQVRRAIMENPWLLKMRDGRE